MGFWDHLEELRGALLRSLAALCVLSCLGLIFKEELFAVILAPTRDDFWLHRLLGQGFRMELINIDISAQFFIHLKASVGAGFVLAFPYIIWEIWKFIAPALYRNEKKAVRAAFLMASVLFYIGVIVGYFFVLPICLQFFLNYSVSPEVTNTFSLTSYMSMFTSMVLLIGLCFEFPTVMLVLTRLGVVTRKTLRKGRKYAFLVLMVFSALITPADPFSMFVLAFPLYLLYELTILLCSSPRNRDSTSSTE